jgi:predicted amidohydrolase YtcJ
MSESVDGFVLREVQLVPLRGYAAPPGPVDVRVAGGRVVQVGRVGERLDRLVGVDEVRGAGRWLVPGLWDHHVHVGQWTLASQRLDLSTARSVEDALRRVSERLAELPDVPVVGWGHRSGSWERQPTVQELDEVTGVRPVVLISGDGHHAWINTVALRGLKLAERDDVVRETEWFAAYPRLVDLVGSDGTSPDAYQHTMRQAAASGVVGLVDLEFDQSASEWPEREAGGASLLRVRVGAYVDTLDDFLAAKVRTGDPMPGCSPLVTMGPLKVISDGSLNTGTAWCCSSYGHGGGAGAPNITSEGLRAVMEAANRHGLEVAIHAIGDAAVEQALAEFGTTGARGSIEHAQLIAREHSRAMARLGVRASVQPAHLLDDRDLTEAVWHDRCERCFALRWLQDDGVELAFGSDAPVSPLDPWLAIAAAVHRSGDEREPWHPEQALTAAEALGASTDGWGTVAPGHPADLALLDTDPLAGGSSAQHSSAQQATALRSMQVAATWVAGGLVHSAL